MLTPTLDILHAAEDGGYAVGGFNVYNLEGVKAVVEAAEVQRSPVLLQVHPGSIKAAGMEIIDLCVSFARGVNVPVSVHLDHTPDLSTIAEAIQRGVGSVMADGSHLTFTENANFVRGITEAFHPSVVIEAELGRISGTEDGLTIADIDARMTDPEQAVAYLAETKADMLAVCIGNVHGPYPGEPRLDFERLERIRDMVNVPLVLHGASGLGDELIHESIRLGVRKFNVNTEVRRAYLAAARTTLDDQQADLTTLMSSTIDAMRAVVVDKLRLFGSVNRANDFS